MPRQRKPQNGGQRLGTGRVANTTTSTQAVYRIPTGNRRNCDVRNYEIIGSSPISVTTEGSNVYHISLNQNVLKEIIESTDYDFSNTTLTLGTVDGNITFEGNLTAEGTFTGTTVNATSIDATSIEGDSITSATLTVTALTATDATISDTLTVNGDATVESLSVTNGVETNTLSANTADIQDLTASTATVDGTLNVSGLATMDNGLEVSGNASLETLGVSGVSTLATANVTTLTATTSSLSTATVGTLTATGGTTLNGVATFNGATTVTGAFTTTDNATLATLNVTGNETVGGNLTVNGDITANDDITVNGLTKLHGAVEMDSTVDIAGNLEVDGSTTIAGQVNAGTIRANDVVSNEVRVANGLYLNEGAIAPQIVLQSEKNKPNGVAALDVNGKINSNVLPAGLALSFFYETSTQGSTTYQLQHTPVSDSSIMVFTDSGTALFPTIDYTCVNGYITFTQMGEEESAIIWVVTSATSN